LINNASRSDEERPYFVPNISAKHKKARDKRQIGEYAKLQSVCRLAGRLRVTAAAISFPAA
jgi:hypothetical protein